MVIDLKAKPVPQDIDSQRGYYINEFIKAALQPVLIIGEPNKFDAMICYFQGINKYGFTYGDLNWGNWDSLEPLKIINTVFCFDVIEHLINPGLFLRDVMQLTHNLNADYYITFPYRHNVKYWSNTHFQEYDQDRFRTLVEICGYQIIREQHIILHRPWQFYLGFRPILRLLFNKYHYNLYLLRLK